MNIKSILLILVLAIALVFTGCSETENQEASDTKIIVSASVVPVASFVEAVAGDLVNIVTVVPPGNSPANYQPTTKEMQSLSDADIYFVVQVPTEEANILPKIADFNKDIKMVNLREVTSEVYPLRHMGNHSHDEDEEHNDDITVDPHIWLSPKRVMLIVQTIADELSELDAFNAEIYQKNASDYIKELETLDINIKDIVATMDNKSFMIYHGSYGYFSDDYGLEMISIEADGKAATAARIQQVIQHAKAEGITTIYYQDEFDDTQAQTVAQEIGGSVIKSTPLTKDYIQGLTNFASALANNGE